MSRKVWCEGADDGKITLPMLAAAPSQAAWGAQSPAVRRLKAGCSGELEWWVVRPPADDARFVTQECPAETFVTTWAGAWPEPADGPPTARLERGVFGPLRRFADGRRNRYRHGGFDLDLSYVTTRIVAMGFPAKGSESMYRNPRQEVKRFLSGAHGDHYRIYNLCIEAAHTDNGFEKETVRFPCPDHCPPQLSQMLDFCRDAKAYLTQAPENVVVVHCKAGKGRTGTMISALLLFSGAVSCAYEALRLFEHARGGARPGVTVPDQIRWVAMLERYLRHGQRRLLCSPIGAPGGYRYRLRSLQLGPFAHEAHAKADRRRLRLELATRQEAAAGRLGHHVVKDAYVDPEGGGMLRLDLDAVDQALKQASAGPTPAPLPAAPTWTELEGLLAVWIPVVEQGASGAPSLGSCMRPATRPRWKRISVWWNYAYLHRSGGTLALQVSKAFINGLQKDMGASMLVPEDFRVVAEFVDARASPPREDAAKHAASNVQEQHQHLRRAPQPAPRPLREPVDQRPEALRAFPGTQTAEGGDVGSCCEEDPGRAGEQLMSMSLGCASICTTPCSKMRVCSKKQAVSARGVARLRACFYELMLCIARCAGPDC